MSQLPLDFTHRPAMGAEDFLVSPCNAEAVGWLDRWPHWQDHAKLGPALVLYGPGGCGKSHLLQVWRHRSGAPQVAATEPNVPDWDSLPALAMAANALALDDADRFLPDTAAEAMMFHLFNRLAASGGTLLLTATLPPSLWRFSLADLRSRLMAAPAVAVQPPDDALLSGLLVKLFADRQLRVGDEVIGFLVTHMERSFNTARLLVAALDEAALAEQRRITVPLARAVLERFS